MTSPSLTSSWQPPAVPSKYDVIPIHQSDIAAFKKCRRYWDFSSPTRTNLRRKVNIFGVNIPLFFGSGIHYALEQYYNPILQRDPVESFTTWFTMQWEGGELREDQLDLSYDLNPRLLPDGTYQVHGLRDLHPDPDHEEFDALRQLGTGMMGFYRDYAQRMDDFEVIAAESSFSIPLGFESIDLREESPNYNQKLEVHARGKRDAIIYTPDTNTYGIIDHKTAAKIDEDYFLKLENDPQCSTYIWASIEEAKMHDLPWTKINEVVYNALRKVAPTPPTILKSGVPSIDRTKEGATAQMFEEVVKSNQFLIDWYDSNDKAKAYYEYLLTEGDRVFVQRDIAHRNQYEIAATGREIRMIAEDMLDSPKIYKNPTGSFTCTKCAFRSPCLATDDGSDAAAMFADGYELNRDR